MRTVLQMKPQRAFEAKYAGTCQSCKQPIERGTQIVMAAARPLHAECLTPVTTTRVPPEVSRQVACPTCLVAAGQPCVGVLRKNGLRRQRTSSHAERVRAYLGEGEAVS